MIVSSTRQLAKRPGEEIIPQTRFQSQTEWCPSRHQWMNPPSILLSLHSIQRVAKETSSLEIEVTAGSIRNIHTHKLLRGDRVAFPHHGSVSLWSHELHSPSSVSFAYPHGACFRHAYTAQDRLFSAYPGLIWVTRFIMTKWNHLIGQRGMAPHERGPSGRGIALRQLWTSRWQRAGGQKTC